MATFNVSTSAQLTAALSQASGGDKILLAAGDYGQLSITGNYDSPLTIASADSGNPASFSTMSINGAENVTIDSVMFDYDYTAGDSQTYRPFAVTNSEKIVIQNSVFEGDTATGTGTVFDGFGTGFGLSVRGSSGVEVENNEFKGFGTALQISESQNVVIGGNNIHDIRKDGMNIIETQGIIIENNNIHDFKGLEDWTDHRDMIQFWTSGTDKPSTDIIIRNNLLDIGQGSYTQTIFMRNELVDTGRAGEEMFYQNVLIENNTIINHHTHGITVGETNGLVIQNNTLTAAIPDASEPSTQWLFDKYGPTAGVLIPLINVSGDAENVNINGNDFYGGSYFTGDRVDGGTGTDWSITGNVSHPNDPGPQPGTGGGGTDGGTGGGGSGGGTGGGTDGGTGGEPPVLDDYVANFVSMVGTTALRGNALVKNGVLELDGTGDYANLGHLSQFEKSDALSFSIDFSRDVADGGVEKLVWNHQKIALVLRGDGLFVKVAGEDGKFKLFSSGDLDLNDTDKHSISVIVDSDSDRIQVIVDGDIAIDRSDIDLDLGRAPGRDWLLGGAKWGYGIDGDITGFQIEADASFFNDADGVLHHDAALF